MIDSLKWCIEMGADEAIEDVAINRYNTPKLKEKNTENTEVKPLPRKIESPANTALNTREQAENCNSLDELRKIVTGFQGISITKTATNTVFADGNPNSNIMMIGEAPGAEEDAQGIPFCGASGKMLDQMFSYVGLVRAKNFYISNTLFWRPPGNRRPTPEELAICLPFVEKHIALVNPKLIILVGGTAVTALLDDKNGITKMRGKFFDYSNRYVAEPIKVTAVFHPSYLLRSPGQKKLAWQDALMIQQYIKENGLKI
ncbi:MAG: uracil-DNA glycosylase, family 4 [Rickettsiaceae bacterium]|nr:uracil-DNA glycosylase, family 4 [Rickettsiaceae bacterium]